MHELHIKLARILTDSQRAALNRKLDEARGHGYRVEFLLAMNTIIVRAPTPREEPEPKAAHFEAQVAQEQAALKKQREFWEAGPITGDGIRPLLRALGNHYGLTRDRKGRIDPGTLKAKIDVDIGGGPLFGEAGVDEGNAGGFDWARVSESAQAAGAAMGGIAEAMAEFAKTWAGLWNDAVNDAARRAAEQMARDTFGRRPGWNGYSRPAGPGDGPIYEGDNATESGK